MVTNIKETTWLHKFILNSCFRPCHWKKSNKKSHPDFPDGFVSKCEHNRIEGKRYLRGMLYAEKLTFDGALYRTTSMNKTDELIYLKNKELQVKKRRKSVLKTSSHKGSFMVQISSRFIADLKRLADLKRKMDEMDELGKLLKS